ncbi:hypothetical protein ACP4OV_021620 [Aristida adscensionis]
MRSITIFDSNGASTPRRSSLRDNRPRRYQWAQARNIE